MNTRCSTLIQGIKEGKIGCPAASHALCKNEESLRCFVIPNQSPDAQMLAIYAALHVLFHEEHVKMLALFPEEEPKTDEHRDAAVHSIIRSMSFASHRIYRDALDILKPDISAELHEALTSIPLTEDQLHLLWNDFDGVVWPYVQNCTRFKLDLVLAPPLIDASGEEADADGIIYFSVGPQYPPYPDHLRRSEHTALIVNLESDIPKLPNTTKSATTQWANTPNTITYVRGAHVPHPPLSMPDAITLSNTYRNVRYALEQRELVPNVPLTLSDIVQLCYEQLEITYEELQEVCSQVRDIFPDHVSIFLMKCLEDKLSYQQIIALLNEE